MPQPGSIVHFRGRDWVVLPSESPELKLRPLSGVSEDAIAVHEGLIKLLGASLPTECLRPSKFPPPSTDNILDAASCHLLWQAARLTLREGATPLRSLGRISIRPRNYQFVPLLMALRLDPVRLLIADDVGVGKTIEALLVVRELWDRGEIQRFAVLCPPYLCDQWERELREKFNFDPVIVRSSTISTLERRTPHGKTFYEQFPVLVVSIDWVKSDRNRHLFLHHCPELVIVDEAHGAAEANSASSSQQQRHRLLRDIAADPDRHLLLLTATPHSGISDAFRSLLGLLRPEFRQWDIANLGQEDRRELARHFIQRTRRDILQSWEAGRCFPERQSVDETYRLSPAYRDLFDQTYRFCQEIVKSSATLDERYQRVRHWGALALLRCVMSSPAAAAEALRKREKLFGEPQADAADEPDRSEQPLPAEEPDYSPHIFEQAQEPTDDEAPTPPIDHTELTLPQNDRQRLRQVAKLAESLQGPVQDNKLKRCMEIVRKLLREKFHPIIWCRYVATAEYVGEHLRHALDPDVQVLVVTGRLGDEERRAQIDAISVDMPRVLVATDCLSEGINLQEKFTAVVHYDLPWNPNRLEQREGRVDRFGQTAPVVKAVRFYGQDNPVDGAVIEVLLEKAKEIYRTLGTYVPVPEDEETFMEAVFAALFRRKHLLAPDRQLSLFSEPTVAAFHRRWDEDVRREQISRTRFAQRAIKPEEVHRELQAVDAVLGDPEAVRQFVLTALERLGVTLRPDRANPLVYSLDLAAKDSLPEAVAYELPSGRTGTWRISFDSPTPEGAEYIGRNHRFVVALARYLLELAIAGRDQQVVSRCGAIRTQAVSVVTALLLLRVRFLVTIPEKTPLLAEEVLVLGYRPFDPQGSAWLPQAEALTLLASAQPAENIPLREKKELVHFVLDQIGTWGDSPHAWDQSNRVLSHIRDFIFQRARELADSHKRIRQAVRLRVRELKVEPQFPPDLLGLLVLQPVVQR